MSNAEHSVPSRLLSRHCVSFCPFFHIKSTLMLACLCAGPGGAGPAGCAAAGRLRRQRRQQQLRRRRARPGGGDATLAQRARRLVAAKAQPTSLSPTLRICRAELDHLGGIARGGPVAPAGKVGLGAWEVP